MASSSYSAHPLTLPVSDLARSTSFYLAALAPLGYGFISKVQHQTSAASSEAIGLGPQGSSRVDVFLSQSYRIGAAQPNGTHVVFPAASRIAVRNFYAAALDAGGRPVARPDNLAASDGMFASIVTDIDGNQIEVCFADGVSSPNDAAVDEGAASVAASSQAGGSIQKWRESVADGEPAESVGSSTTPTPAKPNRASQALKSAASAATQAQTLKSAVSAATSSRGRPRRSSGGSQGGKSSKADQKNSIISTPSVNVGGKAVVGTLIGAAAGAALAYTMVRSKQDSQEQEEEHKRQLRSNEAKAEARAHANRMNAQQTSGKIEMTDRDSGYSSGSHHEPILSMIKHRSVTYPQPSSSGTSRGRSSTRKFLEYGPRTVSPDSYRPPSRRQSVGASSQSTVKPVKRSQSSAGSRRSRSSRRPISPLRLPAPPSMPPDPPTRSRRNSIATHHPSAPRHSASGAKDKPPSSFSRAMGSESRRQEPSQLERAPSSHHSARSARNIPLPASSTAPSMATARPPSSHRSNKTARRVPLPPSEAPTALTAKALSQQNKSHPLSTGSALDDLGTVVPDDSISCASEREERRDRESRASRRSHRTSSKTSKRSGVPVR